MELSQRRARIVGRLRSRRTRERTGMVLVEGVRAVGAALDAGAEISFAVVAPRLATTPAGRSLEARLAEHDVVRVDDQDIMSLADTATPQGVLVVAVEPRRSLDEAGGARLLVLDALQDPGNVGTLVRAAVAFGAEPVVCLDGTVDPWSPKAVRASAGLVFRSRPIMASVDELVRRVREAGVPLLVADAAGQPVERHAPAERFALVVGNEGSGVRQELREAADARIAVLMSGPAESLNAGVAGAVLLYTLTRDASDG